MRNIRFHFYVKDKDGHIEMEIYYFDSGKFLVHYPRYENQSRSLRANSCFAEMKGYQVGMLILAYSESEFVRFMEEFEEFVKNGNNTNY